MRHFIILIFIYISSTTSQSIAQNCACTYTVPLNGQVDGIALNIKPGDVICLSSAIKYGSILFENLQGTAAKPIIIKNCGGKVVINSIGSFGIKFENSKHLKFLGNGDVNNKYGIKITTHLGFFLSFEEFTTNFEVAFIEIAGGSPTNLAIPEAGFAGIGVKTKPYCDGSSDRGVWTMYNPIIHDNYIHHTGGEGMYIGHGFYKGRIEALCTDSTFSHSIVGLRVYNNIIENTGYDGLQIKNADADCEVYNNVIQNYGVNNVDSHNEGLFLGEGVTGKVHHNWIKKGTGNGIQFQGMGNNDIYNNVIINSGQYGFYGADGAYVVRFPTGYINVFNNTIINSGMDGFALFGNTGGTKRLYNNIIAKAGTELIRNGAVMDIKNNYTSNNLIDVKFANVSVFDLHLLPGSPAINTGKNLSAFPIVNLDYDYMPRPFSSGYDIGAFEYGSSVNPPPVVNITSPVNNATFVAGNAVLISATASDPNGTIIGVDFYNGSTKIGQDLASPYTYSLSATSPAGVYNITAKATDNQGSITTSLLVKITLTNQMPTVSIATPLANATFPPGSNIAIDAIASDVDGSILKVEFFEGTNKIGEDLTMPYTINWNNIIPGTYNLSAKVTDNAGGVTTSIPVIVNLFNITPLTGISSPANNSTCDAGSTLVINAWASDEDGTISKVEFFNGSTKIGEDIVAPYSIAWVNIPAGTFTITAKATDNLSGIKISTPKVGTAIVNVPASAYIFPVVNAGIDQTYYLPKNTCSLPGSAISFDGTALSLSWSKVSGGSANLSNINSSGLVVNNMGSGTYVFRLTATDKNGMQSFDDVSVIVKEFNVTLEAEDAEVFGAYLRSNNAGFTGTGYVDYTSISNAYIEWNINASSPGTYNIAFRYAHHSPSRALELKVNNVVIPTTVSFPGTLSWTNWSIASFTVELVEGNNTIRLSAIGESGPNIDNICVFSLVSNARVSNKIVEEFSALIVNTYPNPASDFLSVNTNKEVEVSITDFYGTPLFKKIFDKFSITEIDISHLADGVYFLLISSEMESMTRKLIIRH